MSRKILSFFIALLTLAMCVVPAYAADDDVSITNVQELADGSTIIDLDNGGQLIISPVYDIQEHANTRATTLTKTGNKSVTCTSNGTVEWKYILTATFSYTPGVSVSCTNARYTNNIYDNSWTFSNGSATRSGNVANGKGQYIKKVLGITVKNQKVDIHITCDVNGNLS